MPNILLLEDDPALGSGLKLTLEIQGFKVDWKRDLQEALAYLQESSSDLYLLDWNLPDGSGLDMCESIRKTDASTPIIFLTARNNEEDAVTALTKGANDFIRKPFGQQELIARIRRALQDFNLREEELRFGELTLKLKSRQAFLGQTPLIVNRREFDILSFLCKRANTVVTREEILQSINAGGEVIDRTIDSHISHIRLKLRKHGAKGLKLGAVYGVGYKLETVDAP